MQVDLNDVGTDLSWLWGYAWQSVLGLWKMLSVGLVNLYTASALFPDPFGLNI